jgi:RNase P/RNase MRP subunit p29
MQTRLNGGITFRWALGAEDVKTRIIFSWLWAESVAVILNSHLEQTGISGQVMNCSRRTLHSGVSKHVNT